MQKFHDTCICPRVQWCSTGAIGNTPLVNILFKIIQLQYTKQPQILIKGLSEKIGSQIYAASRIVLLSVTQSREACTTLICIEPSGQFCSNKGRIKPGGTVVEGTAGNTGIGLAHVCRAKGYQCVIYMPDSQVCFSAVHFGPILIPMAKSQEKIDLLRMLGADVHPVPVVPFDKPKNYNHQAREYAKSINNAIWTNQFNNVANAQAHYTATGPEIWKQTKGDLDGFVCATGTGRWRIFGQCRKIFEREESSKDPNMASRPSQ